MQCFLFLCYFISFFAVFGISLPQDQPSDLIDVISLDSVDNEKTIAGNPIPIADSTIAASTIDDTASDDSMTNPVAFSNPLNVATNPLIPVFFTAGNPNCDKSKKSKTKLHPIPGSEDMCDIEEPQIAPPARNKKTGCTRGKSPLCCEVGIEGKSRDPGGVTVLYRQNCFPCQPLFQLSHLRTTHTCGRYY